MANSEEIQSVMDSVLDQIADKRVLVIGDVMVDHYIWGTASRISPEAPVPVLHVDKETYVLGGAANVACNLSGLGMEVDLLGAYGEDLYGKHLRGLLESQEITLRPEGFSADCPTICKSRVVAQRQQVCRVDRESGREHYALDQRLEDSFFEEVLESYDFLVFSDYAKGVITDPLLDRVRAWHQKESTKALLAFDPKPRHRLDLRGMALMTPNWGEAVQMSGLSEGGSYTDQGVEVCKAIYEQFQPKYLVVTLGENGILLCENGNVIGHIPTVAREVYDVSGAGDTVIAVLASALYCDVSLEQAAHFANIAAGIVVSHYGNFPITREALSRR